MIEDFIIELEKPNKAIKILTHFIQELIIDGFEYEECQNPKLKIRYVLSLVYALELINNDIAKLKREFYKNMLKNKYNRKGCPSLNAL